MIQDVLVSSFIKVYCIDRYMPVEPQATRSWNMIDPYKIADRGTRAILDPKKWHPDASPRTCHMHAGCHAASQTKKVATLQDASPPLPPPAESPRDSSPGHGDVAPCAARGHVGHGPPFYRC